MLQHISEKMWRVTRSTTTLYSQIQSATHKLLQPSKNITITDGTRLVTSQCSYCTNIQHKFSKTHVPRRLLQKRLGQMQPYEVSCSAFVVRSLRHYSTMIPKTATVVKGNAVPLAKTAPLRRPRKKPLEDVEDPPHHRNVVSYAVGEDLDLCELRKHLELSYLYDFIDLPRDIEDVLLISAKYKVDGQQRDAFFFRDGSSAFWNMAEAERHELMKAARKHAKNPYTLETILSEVEKMPVTYDRVTKLVKDTVYLKTLPDGVYDETLTLQKFAFSNALSQSVILSVNEGNLETFVAQLEPETQKLRSGQKSYLNKRDINMRLGEIFSLRHEINLESGYLDTPDIYWEREPLELIYRETLLHLNVPKRIRVLNERLNYCSEILQLFGNQLNDGHHVRLEWIIIILILIEVGFECMHYAERFGYVQVPERSVTPALTEQATFTAVDQTQTEEAKS